MKELLQHRDISYFNDTDYYLVLNNLGQWLLSDLETSNGKWYPRYYRGFIGGKLYPSGYWRTINGFYAKGCSQINMSSIESVNCNELIGREVRFVNTEIKGTITKFLLHNMGINWYRGQDFKKYGFPMYWNEPRNLELT